MTSPSEPSFTFMDVFSFSPELRAEGDGSRRLNLLSMTIFLGFIQLVSVVQRQQIWLDHF